MADSVRIQSKVECMTTRDWLLDDVREEANFAALATLTHTPISYAVPQKLWVADEGKFLYSDARRGVALAEAVPPGQILRAFAALYNAESQPQRVVRFARKYGVLWVCEHQRPESATPGWLKFMGCLKCSDQWQEPADSMMRREPISAWTHYAREVNAMLSIRSCLDGDKDLSTAQLEQVMTCLKPSVWQNRNPHAPPSTLEMSRATDSDVVMEAERRLNQTAQSWINMCAHHGGLTVQANATGHPNGPNRLEVGLKVVHLAGALALDLAGVLSARVKSQRCTEPGCQNELERRPGPRRRCDACKEEANRLKRAKHYYRTHPEAQRTRKYRV